MTAHELARKLLEGPDVPVVLVGHVPNDDTFDEIDCADAGTAWKCTLPNGHVLGTLWASPGHRDIKSESQPVVVLR